MVIMELKRITDTDNITYQNLLTMTKTELRGKFIDLSCCCC